MELLLSAAILISLTFYMLAGGVDYGAGIWGLLARGKDEPERRELISQAIGPIWQANHLWLILVIILLFTAFPRAFALVFNSLRIPLAMMLIGIVLRTAFVVRSNAHGRRRNRIGARFGLTSAITPVLFGIIIGAIASGNISTHAFDFYRMYVQPWFSPFPIAAGALTLALFAQLAAVHLAAETNDKNLQDDFRIRAIAASAIVIFLAAAVYVIAENGAHFVYRNLQHGSFSLILKTSVLAITAVCMFALWKRQFRIARIACAGQSIIILWGWALAQFPYLIVPQVTVYHAAPIATLKLVLWCLSPGALMLALFFFYLFRNSKAGKKA